MNTWLDLLHRRREQREREREDRERREAADKARADLRERLRIGPHSTQFLTGSELSGEICWSLQELWAAVDALERRTRPP